MYRQNQCWEVKPELHNCPLAKPSEVAVSPVVQVKVRRLNERFPHLEWMAYLFVDDTDGTKHITDLIIPRQVVSAYAVEPQDFPMVDGIRGTIHSHHGLSLGATFSSQDDRYLRGNHDVSVVVSGDAWKVSTREIAPCGNYNYMDAEIVFVDKVPVRIVAPHRLPILSWFSGIGKARHPTVSITRDAFDQEIDDNISTGESFLKSAVRPVAKITATSTPKSLWRRFIDWFAQLNWTGRIGR